MRLPEHSRFLHPCRSVSKENHREANLRPGKRVHPGGFLPRQRYLAAGEAVAKEHGDSLLLLDREVVKVVGELHQLPILPVELQERPEIVAQRACGQQSQHLENHILCISNSVNVKTHLNPNHCV